MYKILSLDGGGSWSIMQLLTLKEKYGNIKGHEILKEFDMVIANSGGSIILAALVENWNLDEALSLFKEKKNREQIFSKNSFWERYFPIDILGQKFGPRYSTKRKGEALKRLFPNTDKFQMEELPAYVGNPKIKFIVSTYDALNNKAKFFKSYHNTRNYIHDSVRLTQAIHGSSNAPVLYFDFPARFKAKSSEIFYELWDGALGGFNNPVVAGIIEALNSGISLNEIKIISIGTGNKTMSIKEKENFYKLKQLTIKERSKKWRFWRWKFQLKYLKLTILNQAKTILYQPPDWANYVALMFLKQSSLENINNSFIRLSPIIHIDSHTNNSVISLLEKLYNLDMDITNDEDFQILTEGFIQWKNGLINNQPIDYHIGRDNELIYIHGDKKFSDAMAKW
jgi:uncharacterized protein